jgi:phosphoglucosamine mutase
MKKLFGTDGIRGPAGQFPLDAATVRILGSSLATHLRAEMDKNTPVIVIGRDTRESGSWLEESFVSGATSAGADCRSAGVITTPGIAFLTRTLPGDAGVVISASHNPYYDNGVKIFSPSGKKLPDATERLLERDIFVAQRSDDLPDTPGRLPQSQQEAEDLRELYLDFLFHEIAAGLSLSGITVVLDCANGAASELAPKLFARLGAKVIAINNRPDGQNINKDCGSLNIKGLQRAVIENHADLGVAFDGDADRALFADDAGRFVDGDGTMWVLAQYLDQRGELGDGVVVGTVMSNIGLEIALRSRGLRLVRTDVGDKYVLDELVKTGARLGGEQSGHLIFPRLSLAGDGMITALCLLRAMRDDGKSLSQATEGFKQYPQVLVNVPVVKKIPFDEIEVVQDRVREINNDLVDRGRLLLRYSGTESLARVMIEGDNQEEIEVYANGLAEVIRQEIGSS